MTVLVDLSVHMLIFSIILDCLTLKNTNVDALSSVRSLLTSQKEFSGTKINNDDPLSAQNFENLILSMRNTKTYSISEIKKNAVIQFANRTASVHLSRCKNTLMISIQSHSN